ncbi:hypothetical protein HID58_070395 [Brassica napus]|uniref:Uncharacterized protein n=1 Tax=Brassica napus TaxID=3708 RepID=A0ABQ7YYP4_BRANA|nr:hypothetical protein HID58_070395 [Brassica napus]
MEDILEIENEEQLEILGQDSKLKLDVDQHPTGKDLDTSPKASINRYPPYIDRHSWLNELPSCMIELEPVEKRMDKSKASHFPVPEHLKSHICAEKAAGFHKRMEKYLTLITYTISEDEFSILPDRSVFDDLLYAIAPKKGLRYKCEVDRGPSVVVSNDTTLGSQHPS